jgi:hypothetical protein
MTTITEDDIINSIGTGRRFYWKRSKGWQWFDDGERWWVFEVEFLGFNGGCGYWINEHMRWNSQPAGTSHFIQPRTLSAEESQELVEAIIRETA